MGYFIMLIAMTYQTELFVMVVLGLTAGHAVFNLDGPVLESAEVSWVATPPYPEATRGATVYAPDGRSEHLSCLSLVE
jgi:hypothetical protein